MQERLGQSTAQQQVELGASDEQFLRLRGMRLPRPNRFSEDAQRIALACELGNSFGFTKAMLLARGIAGAATDISPNTARTTDSRRVAEPSDQYYIAAFDAQDDLDVLPDSDARSDPPQGGNPQAGPPEPGGEGETR